MTAAAAAVLSPGDQLRLSIPAPRRAEPQPGLTGQTLTVVSVSQGALVVETADQTQTLLTGGSPADLTLWYGLRVLHPWRLLAAHFPDALRLTVGRVGGEGRLVRVAEAARYAGGAGRPAAFLRGAFLTAGWMTPDGAATFQPRFEGAAELALRTGCEGWGWEWGALGGGTQVWATLRLPRPTSGEDVTVHGRACGGALALAYAMRLGLEVSGITGGDDL